MKTRYEHHDVVWVDLESPTHDEVREIIDEFGIDLLTAEELLLPSMKPRAEFKDEYIYVVMHFPALRHSHKADEQEVDFIIGRNFLITTRYDVVDPLHKFSKVVEVNEMLAKGKSAIGEHAGFLFFYMLKRLYKSVDHEVEYVQRHLHNIEEHVFSGHEVQMVQEISNSARDLLNLRQTIEPHREVLHALEQGCIGFFGDSFMPYLRGLSDDYFRVHNHIMRSLDVLRELRETNNSLLTTKQNETMRRFTVMAFFTFPLMLLAAIFAMDTTDMPIVGMRHDFWIVLGMMTTVSLLMYWSFKRTQWL